MISSAFFPFPLYFNSKTCLWFSYAFVKTLRTMSTLSWGEYWLCDELCAVLVDSLETICFHLYLLKKKIRKNEKKKKIVWFALMSLIYAIFICFIVIFENLVELYTLVWKSLVSLSIWTHNYLIEIFELGHLLLIF